MAGGGAEIPGTSYDGLAGHQYRAVRHSIVEVGKRIDATRGAREYGKDSVNAAAHIGMTGIFATASKRVYDTADEAVKALVVARARLEDLAKALLDQGA